MTNSCCVTLIGVLRLFMAFGTCLVFTFASISTRAAYQSAISGKTEAGVDRFLIAQREGVGKNPSAVEFAIRLKESKDRFQQGEIIHIELSFSSTLPNSYQLDGGLYDRGGRLDIDSFHIDPPDGAVDPLKGREPSSMGGLRSMPTLDVKPYLIVRDLNEYLRFDKPGKYRLYVVSNRVRHQPPAAVPATSNIIEFTVLPLDPEWAGKQYKSALMTLDDDRSYPNSSRRDEEVRSATRVIRFLGTEDAVRYMVRHLDNAQDDFGFGLMGSPLQATVVKEMEDGLEQPDCAVSDWYLSVLCSCSYGQKYSRWPEPYPGAEDKAKLALWQQEQAKAQLARNAIRQAYMDKLATAVPRKEGRTKAITLNAFISEMRRAPNDRADLPVDLVKKLSSELARVFFDLPAWAQQYLIKYQWDLIKSQEMMPVLERYYENPSQEKNTNDTSLAGIALRRIFEMEPKRGRELMLREIAHPTGRVQFEALAMLPDKTLPQMDDAFASAMEKSPYPSLEQYFLQAQLMARYGTPAILPRVKAAVLEKGSSWPCGLLTPVIAYCLRVDPAFGAAELGKALSSTRLANKDCRSRMLGTVAGLYACPELEALAVHYLEDPDPEMVIDCAETLGKHGTAQAEAPLWKRFQKWHDEWNNRSEEMQSRMIQGRPELVMSHRMEMAFFSALANAQGWLADAEKLKRIQSLCLSSSIKQTAGYMISDAEGPKKRISFTQGSGDSWSFEVAQYRNISSLETLKAKLAQFTEGTVFYGPAFSTGEATEKKKAVFEELKRFLAGLGMRLEELQQPK
jgi:hypothetical protein